MPEIKPIAITNSQGFNLFGTLHQPQRLESRLPAVVLVSPGVKMRVGPGRLYVPLTRALNDLGFLVLRFDFYGLGDSEGELNEQMLADVYNHIEVGRYVNDTLCALNWLTKECGYERFILGGLCGGAVTALLAADKDDRVEGLLSLGMNVTLASNSAKTTQYITQGQLVSLRRGYYRRLFQPRSWLRFLTFRSDYSVIWRSLSQALSGNSSEKLAVQQQDATPEQGRENVNPLFSHAYLSFLERGGNVLMLFSGADRLLHEYEEKFAVPFASRLQPFLPQIHSHIVAEANHVLSFHVWQQEMVDISRRWLINVYGDLTSV